MRGRVRTELAPTGYVANIYALLFIDTSLSFLVFLFVCCLAVFSNVCVSLCGIVCVIFHSFVRLGSSINRAVVVAASPKVCG